jgi:hypothetical protein
MMRIGVFCCAQTPMTPQPSTISEPTPEFG